MDVTLPNGQVINGVPDGTTKAQLAQKLQANGMDVPKEWLAPPAPVEQPKPRTLADTLGDIGDAGKRYVSDYASGIKNAGKSLVSNIMQSPGKSLMSAPGAILEPVAGAVGNTVADAAALLHSGIDKIPGSSYVGDFDKNATFQQRKAEYEKGVGAYTNPKTNLGKNLTDTLGATLKPVGDVMGLPGKATSGIARLGGASPETAQSVEQGTNALTNALALGKSMRQTPEAAPQQVIPTKSELKQTSQAAYKRAKDAGATITGESFGKAIGDAKAALTEDGLNPKLNPATTAALEHISGHEGPVTVSQLDTYRKVAQNAEKSAPIGSADARFAGKLVDSIDEYVDNISSKDVIGGDTPAAIAALKEARTNWSRYRKTDTIDNLMDRAELRATQFSGSGAENAIRTEFRSMAMNKRRMSGFSAAEQAAIRKVATGGPVDNALRYFGKLAPTGVVSAVAAESLGGPAAMVGGALSRKLAQHSTEARAANAQQLMRAGPGYQPPPNSPMFPFNINPSAPVAGQLSEMALTPEQRRQLIAQAIQ